MKAGTFVNLHEGETALMIYCSVLKDRSCNNRTLKFKNNEHRFKLSFLGPATATSVLYSNTQ